MSIKKMTETIFNNQQATPRPMQEWAYNQSKEGKNLLIVSSTGSGKTEAAYLASQHWDRIAYALPMTTLATSLHERLNTYEKRLSGTEWTLQHSVSSNDAWLENDRAVTTIDQVLSGYFGFGRESFIRGKNVMRSSLILDEVQLFDPESALLSLLSLLKQTTTEPFNNNFCIMTATFPTSLRTYLKDNFNVEVYIEEIPSIHKEVRLDWADSMPVEEIKNNEEKQIIVCNTQKQQVDLYTKLLNEGVDEERILVLNSRLFPNDREAVEAKVTKYFGKGSEENNKILISTQIIEAGMDISADTLYTYEAPIDSLVQREGRTSRWGGEGRFIVVQQERMNNGLHPVYDNDLVENTTQLIKRNAGCLFSWENQLAWIDEVLDPMYKKILSPKSLRRFNRKLANGSSRDLIRDMQNVNVIPIENYPYATEDYFNRFSISLPANLIKQGLIFERDGIKETKSIDNGDTFLVDANNWEYGVCGLRKGFGMKENKAISLTKSSDKAFEDYIEETLIEHLKETANQMVKLVKKEDVINVQTDDYNVWNIGATHDIGKATKAWQRMIRWNGDGTYASDVNLYAHRPWIPRLNTDVRNRTHSLIGNLLLKDQLTKMEKNVIAYHHGRIFATEGKYLIRTEWEEDVNEVLGDLGFQEMETTTNSYYLLEEDFYTPKDSKWGEVIYLTGVLMESDRKAIEILKKQKSSVNPQKVSNL